MKLAASQLEKHLNGPLASVYVVTGDDPLLTGEALDAIRQAVRRQGFTERQVLVVETGFDWSLLQTAGASLSLFAERRWIELRIAQGKLGDKGAAAVQEYLAHSLHDDTLLLISLPRLEAATLRARWAKALLEHQAVQFIQVWPPDWGQLPQWIAQRFQRAQLRVTPEVIEFVRTQVAGNLLAAAQEIEKLTLLADSSGCLDLATVQAAIADSARYTPFDWVDRMLAGQAAFALQTLHGLKREGADPLILLWALARELRVLAQLDAAQGRGSSLEQAFAQIKPPIWEKRRPLVTQALVRTLGVAWSDWLLEAQYLDAQIKGQVAGDPWIGLERLCLAISGLPTGLAQA